MEKKPKHLYEFGGFRLDAAERQLRRGNELISLTPKAFDLLLVLVEQPGRLLEKEALLQAVWVGSFVEEHNLADTISRLRKALGEGENGQKFIETVPKSGYRFLAPVNVLEEEPAELEPPPLIDPKPEHERVNTAPSDRFSRYRFIPIIGLSVLVLAGIGYFIWRPQPLPKVNAYTQITRDGLQKGSRGFASMVTDGARIYFSEQVNEQRVIAQVSVNGGETVVLPAPLPAAHVKDISPNHAELLIDSGVAVTFEAPLWKVPVLGGAPRRVGEVMSHAAAWTPDGQQIVYANGGDLFIAKSDGSESRKLATVKGRPLWLRWAPDGSRLRFTVRESALGSVNTLWEMAADGSNLRPLLPDWNQPANVPNAPNECCGNWTADGRYYVFQATRNGATNIWARSEQAGLFGRNSSAPVQLTFGPLDYSAPLPSLDGKRIFVHGEQRRGELARFDNQTQQWSTYLSGISAEHLDFSRDGIWVTYVTYPEGNLWRSKVDGSERQQLTYPPLQSSVPRWSPDGKQIVFTARTLSQPWKMYLVAAEGGTPQPLTPDARTEFDPNWSPDGKKIVFCDFEAKILYLFDLATRQSSKLTEGMNTPRWSPDGRYLAASSAVAQGALMLFDFTTQKWRNLGQTGASWSRWSRDGKYLYFASVTGADPALFRLRIDDEKTERLSSLKDFRRVIGARGPWIGWTPDDAPLALRDLGTQEIYALEVELP